MIEKKIISIKKEESKAKEFIMKTLGKGKISGVKIEKTPLGEKIIILTAKPGAVIGKRGETISDLTEALKKEFKMQNPRIEISEIENPNFDAQYVADQIAKSLEMFGTSSFKIIAYKQLERIKNAGALGCEIILSGKLPGEKARSWRFAFGYLKKTGESANLLSRAKTVAQTKPGTTGIKVAILPKGVKIMDKIEIEEKEEKETNQNGNIEI